MINKTVKKSSHLNPRKSKRVFSWVNPKLDAKKSPIEGKGLFATADIKKDEIVGVFGGYVMTLQEIYEGRNNTIRNDHVQIDDYFGIGKIKEEEDRSCFNHSCDPNAGFRGQIILITKRKIKKGEEITFDYAMETCHLKGIPPYKFPCNCGAKNCRKFVTGDDWKMVDLQKKYKGYFQWYIQKKINKLNKKTKNKKNEF